MSRAIHSLGRKRIWGLVIIIVGFVFLGVGYLALGMPMEYYFLRLFGFQSLGDFLAIVGIIVVIVGFALFFLPPGEDAGDEERFWPTYSGKTAREP